MLYEKLMSAWKACDISSWRSCYHEDYTFVSHANGTTMSVSYTHLTLPTTPYVYTEEHPRVFTQYNS